MTDPGDVHRLAELDADIAAGFAADPGTGADPASRAVLDALAATRAELAALPALPLPPELTARWTAALTRVDETGTPISPIEHAAPRVDETGTQSSPIGRGEGERPVMRLDPGRRPRPAGGGTGPRSGRPSAGRRRRVRPALGVGLALAGLLVVAGVLQSRPAQQAVTTAQLGGVARAAVGAYDAGELADPVRRAGCLRAVAPPGLAPEAVLLGGRGVEFEGRAGILLLFGTGELGRFRVVVVDRGCGPGGGALLADALVGQ